MTQSERCDASQIQRCSDLDGVEFRTFAAPAETWQTYTTGFEFMITDTWCGEIRHRRSCCMFMPGMLLAAHPGELISSQRRTVPGSRRSLVIDDLVLRDYVAEHEVEPEKFEFRDFTQMSPGLSARLARVIGNIWPGPATLALHASLVEFAAALVAEVIDTRSAPRSASDRRDRAAERLRECLHHDVSTRLDLSTLAGQVGMSRFQALRAFKRRFGVSPHAYQLSLRLSMAQTALRDGVQPARVATECGFVDQSHLSRHFKRVLGLTPGQYARVGVQRTPSHGSIALRDRGIGPGTAPRNSGSGAAALAKATQNVAAAAPQILRLAAGKN